MFLGALTHCSCSLVYVLKAEIAAWHAALTFQLRPRGESNLDEAGVEEGGGLGAGGDGDGEAAEGADGVASGEDVADGGVAVVVDLEVADVGEGAA